MCTEINDQLCSKESDFQERVDTISNILCKTEIKESISSNSESFSQAESIIGVTNDNKSSMNTLAGKQDDQQIPNNECKEVINDTLCVSTSDDNDKSECEDTNSDDDVINSILTALKLLILNLDVNIGISCSICDENIFSGYRYKCCFCKKYDLCAECFESKKQSQNHVSTHPMFFIANPLSPKENYYLSKIFSRGADKLSTMFAESEHEGISCDVCKVESIKGIRVKCDDCINYDLCWTCYNNQMISKLHKTDHSVVAHLVPIRNTFDVNKDIQFSTDDKKSKGCFGSVQKVQYKGKICALKTITLTGEGRDGTLFKTFKNELFAYSEIHSNHILKFYGRDVKQYDDHVELHLLMEFMEKGSIKDVIERNESLSLRRKFQWILAIIKGIRRIHAKGFVHKDIKPDNILVNSHQSVKIGDMGIAIHDQGKGYFRDTIAPPIYSAPEIFCGKFDNKVDIFSFGLVVYEIFTYKKRIVDPFEGLVALFKNLLLPVQFTEPSKVFMPLIERCVCIEPAKRPMAQEIEKKLEEFDKQFWSSLPVKARDYINLSVEEKDRIFMIYYDSVAEKL